MHGRYGSNSGLAVLVVMTKEVQVGSEYWSSCQGRCDNEVQCSGSGNCTGNNGSEYCGSRSDIRSNSCNVEAVAIAT